MQLQNDKRVFTLCGGQGCCPTVEFEGGQVIFRDDFGGTVRLTEQEWCELTERIKIGEIG
jgi:hypothetical protein